MEWRKGKCRKEKLTPWGFLHFSSNSSLAFSNHSLTVRKSKREKQKEISLVTLLIPLSFKLFKTNRHLDLRQHIVHIV